MKAQTLLWELLLFGRPVRFNELKDASVLKGSTLKATLPLLVKEGKVRRNAKSNKNVTYEVNPENPDVLRQQAIAQELTSEIQNMMSEQGDLARTETSFLENLRKFKRRRARQRFLRLCTYRLTFLEYVFARLIFPTAKFIAEARDPTFAKMLEARIAEALTDLVKSNLETSAEFWKIDPDLASYASDKWITRMISQLVTQMTRIPQLKPNTRKTLQAVLKQAWKESQVSSQVP